MTVTTGVEQRPTQVVRATRCRRDVRVSANVAGEVYLGLGAGDPERRARFAARLTAEQAREVAQNLLDAADRAIGEEK